MTGSGLLLSSLRYLNFIKLPWPIPRQLGFPEVASLPGSTGRILPFSHLTSRY